MDNDQELDANKDQELDVNKDQELDMRDIHLLGGFYSHKRLSRILDTDAHSAAKLGPSAIKLFYRLSDLSRHAEMLENMVLELRLHNEKIETQNDELMGENAELYRRVETLIDTINGSGNTLINQYRNSLPEGIYICDETREEVERKLYEDEIIEDADVDGGLTG